MPQPDSQTSSPLTPRQSLKYTGLALASTAGAAVMVVELGVARVLTPVFGGSITVWAIVIATTMLALALGYVVGGYLADRLLPEGIYFYVVAVNRLTKLSYVIVQRCWY